MPEYTAVNLVRALARGRAHSGYTWAAVCADGKLLCTKCIRGNYRLILRATAIESLFREDWRVIGVTNSGESESTETCVNCRESLWESQS